MTISSQLDVCCHTIDILSQNAESRIESFRVVERPIIEGGFCETLVKNSPSDENRLTLLFKQNPLAKTQYIQKLQDVLGRAVETIDHTSLQRLRTEEVISEGFVVAQRYNHVVRMALDPIYRASLPLFETLHLDRLIRPEECQELLPLSARVDGVAQVKMGGISKDQKIFVTRGCCRHKLYHYNASDAKIHHGFEAFKIFMSTQWERLLAGLGRTIFRRKVACLNRCQYFRNREDIGPGARVYATAAPLLPCREPTSHWVGHSTCVISVPLTSRQGGVVSVNLVTDPVEGSLNACFYPRMTHPSRPIVSIPVPHVILLSHNHMDHYDPKTIRQLKVFQPILLVPKGDGNRLRLLGFRNVFENTWWKTTKIPFRRGEHEVELEITFVPAHHTSGNGVGTANRSAFVGYVIKVGRGDIYFPGDTARLSQDHLRTLRERFRIRGMWQPGGPDEKRSDMLSTHQSSADGVWMHFSLLVRGLYESEGGALQTKGEFLEKAHRLRTLYMHTKTYKLGNLHFDDTEESVRRLREELCLPHSADGLRPYEARVVQEIRDICRELRFSDGDHLTPEEIVSLMSSGVIIPQIGSTHSLLPTHG